MAVHCLVQELCIVLGALAQAFNSQSLQLPAAIAVAVHLERTGLVRTLNVAELTNVLAFLSSISLPAHTLDALSQRACEVLRETPSGCGGREVLDACNFAMRFRFAVKNSPAQADAAAQRVADGFVEFLQRNQQGLLSWQPALAIAAKLMTNVDSKVRDSAVSAWSIAQWDPIALCSNITALLLHHG
jgi:hypothetical protein